jgi:hypothetical protein
MNIYSYFILLLACLFATAAMMEQRSKLVAITMAFTSIICIGVVAFAASVVPS